MKALPFASNAKFRHRQFINPVKIKKQPEARRAAFVSF
jgi:hypothetical protein